MIKPLRKIAAWWGRKSPGTVSAAGRSHVGRVRANNEDALLLRPDIGLFVICDGMGGHAGGEMASRLAVTAIEKAVAGGMFLEAAFAEAHEAVAGMGQPQAIGAGRPGSTVVALQVVGDRWRLAWIGDSRAWLIGAQAVEQLTHDHTEVQRMVDWGDLTAEEARSHPDRHRLSQALGLGSRAPVAGVRDGTCAAGLAFLLASDGLCCWDEPERLAAIVREKEPGPAVDELIERSLAAGGHDNVTCIVVQVENIAGRT